MHIDIDIVIFAVIAVALIFRLWSVLGTRNEDEPQRPNPFIPPTPPPAAAQGDAPFNAPPRLLPPALPPASLAGGLAQVKAVDPGFDEKQFLQKARATFTSVVETYATGDLTGVGAILSPALLAHFQQAADARKAAGQTAQSHVTSIKEAEVFAARAEGTQAFVTVKFISDQENILRDAGGTIIGGEAGKSDEVTDIWVFARDTQAADAKWVVVETRG